MLCSPPNSRPESLEATCCLICTHTGVFAAKLVQRPMTARPSSNCVHFATLQSSHWRYGCTEQPVCIFFCVENCDASAESREDRLLKQRVTSLSVLTGFARRALEHQPDNGTKRMPQRTSASHNHARRHAFLGKMYMHPSWPTASKGTFFGSRRTRRAWSRFMLLVRASVHVPDGRALASDDSVHCGEMSVTGEPCLLRPMTKQGPLQVTHTSLLLPTSEFPAALLTLQRCAVHGRVTTSTSPETLLPKKKSLVYSWKRHAIASAE